MYTVGAGRSRSISLLQAEELQRIINMNVRRLVRSRRLTLLRLCELAGVDRPGLDRGLRGEGEDWLRALCRIAEVLEVPPHNLLTPPPPERKR